MEYLKERVLIISFESLIEPWEEGYFMSLINCPKCGRYPVSSEGRCPNPECGCNVADELRRKKHEEELKAAEKKKRAEEMAQQVEKRRRQTEQEIKDKKYEQQYNLKCPACGTPYKLVLHGYSRIFNDTTESYYCKNCGHNLAISAPYRCSDHYEEIAWGVNGCSICMAEREEEELEKERDRKELEERLRVISRG